MNDNRTDRNRRFTEILKSEYAISASWIPASTAVQYSPFSCCGSRQENVYFLFDASALAYIIELVIQLFSEFPPPFPAGFRYSAASVYHPVYCSTDTSAILAISLILILSAIRLFTIYDVQFTILRFIIYAFHKFSFMHLPFIICAFCRSLPVSAFICIAQLYIVNGKLYFLLCPHTIIILIFSTQIYDNFCNYEIVVSLCPHTKAMKNEPYFSLLSIVSSC